AHVAPPRHDAAHVAPPRHDAAHVAPPRHDAVHVGADLGRPYVVAKDATCTRASLKHAPSPMSVSVAGTSDVPVKPLRVLRRHKPFGRLTVPGRIVGRTVSVECTSPRSLNTRTPSPSASRLAAASCGCIVSFTSGRDSSPSVELIVRSLAGEISASGYLSVAGSG